MDTLKVGLGSLFRTSMTAMLDAIGSTTPKAIVASLESKVQSPQQLARQCVIDEGPETFWKALTGSLLAKIAKTVTPSVPEQLIIIPGELIGSLMHWATATKQSFNRSGSVAANYVSKQKTVITEFFNRCIKKPTEIFLKIIGLDSVDEKHPMVPFTRFIMSQAALFGLGTYALKGHEGENIPGINVDHNDSALTNLFKTIGYIAVEQGTHVASQTMRYFIDYKDEFKDHGGKPLAKALANVVNERTIPGHMLSALTACLSTLTLGKYLPKSTAAAIGEAPMKFFERVVTLKLRRSTKTAKDQNGNVIPGHRLAETGLSWLNGFIDFFDKHFKPARIWTINNIIAPVFKPGNMKIEEFRKELMDSLDRKKELLPVQSKNGNGLATNIQVASAAI